MGSWFSNLHIRKREGATVEAQPSSKAGIFIRTPEVPECSPPGLTLRKSSHTPYDAEPARRDNQGRVFCRWGCCRSATYPVFSPTDRAFPTTQGKTCDREIFLLYNKASSQNKPERGCGYENTTGIGGLAGNPGHHPW